MTGASTSFYCDKGNVCLLDEAGLRPAWQGCSPCPKRAIRGHASESLDRVNALSIGGAALSQFGHAISADIKDLTRAAAAAVAVRAAPGPRR